jgi:GNAT superfamily N-acetyltransferase
MPYNQEFDVKGLSHKVLNKNDSVNGFSCKEEEIDEFIREQALGYQEQNLGVTYVFYFGSKLIGFATLCMGNVNKRKMSEDDNLSKSIASYPALLIGQLGVTNEYQRRGIGKHVCDFCFFIAIHLSQKIGCRFLIVNALDSAVDFYIKYGFTLAPKQEKQKQKLMFLDITKNRI